MPEQFPDTEAAMRAYLRADAGVAALVDGRVFFGFSAESNPKQVTVQRQGGGPDGSEAPVDNAALVFNCWAASKAEAAEICRAVVAAVEALRERTVYAGTALLGGTVDTWFWSPDPQGDRPRYIVTANVTAIAA
jgi:hypothetical protein